MITFLIALSSEERFLFKELIKACNKKINPGLKNLKWNSEVSDFYIADCSAYTAEVIITQLKLSLKKHFAKIQ